MARPASARRQRSGRRSTPPLPVLLVVLAAALLGWYRSTVSAPAAEPSAAVSLDTVPAYSSWTRERRSRFWKRRILSALSRSGRI